MLADNTARFFFPAMFTKKSLLAAEQFATVRRPILAPNELATMRGRSSTKATESRTSRKCRVRSHNKFPRSSIQFLIEAQLAPAVPNSIGNLAKL